MDTAVGAAEVSNVRLAFEKSPVAPFQPPKLPMALPFE